MTKENIKTVGLGGLVGQMKLIKHQKHKCKNKGWLIVFKIYIVNQLQLIFFHRSTVIDRYYFHESVDLKRFREEQVICFRAPVNIKCFRLMRYCVFFKF